MSFDFFLTALIQGMAFAGLGLGVYLTLRIFNIPDITTDGSYTLGGVVTALALVSGWHPLLAIVASGLAGSLAGAGCGLIHTRLNTAPLLAGILMMTALYSVNLIALGRPNLPLTGMDPFAELTGLDNPVQASLTAIVLLVMLIGAKLLFLLKTDFGLAMRATGNSEAMVRAMGVNVKRMKVIGLALANALTAISGSLITQYQGFADINMGIGIVIAGLAAVMIGEAFSGKNTGRSLPIQILAVIAGGVVFRMAIAGALSAGLDPGYLRLITAVIVLSIIALGNLRKPSNA